MPSPTSVFNRFVDLSQEYSESQYRGAFSNSGLPGSNNLDSLSGESAQMVRFVRYKLGEPTLTVELDNSQITALFEEANLEYSRILHMLQISNNFSTIFGLGRGYDEHDLKNKLPNETWNYLRKYTKNIGIFGPTPVGGNVDIRKGYLEATPGKQGYNVYDDLYDEQTGQTLKSVILNSNLSSNNMGVVIAKLYHQAPYSMFRTFDPWSGFSTMSQMYNFESYTLSTPYYMMPVWNDILRGQVQKQSDLVRRSNYSYTQLGETLQLFPPPKFSMKVYLEWFAEPDAFTTPGSLTGSASAAENQINAIWNVPISDIKYDEMNPTARQWIRQYTVALAKQLLGEIRSKFSSIPIPNGDVSLNGDTLMSQAREDMQKLKEELKTDLEQFKKENIMKKEADTMEAAYNQYKYFPIGGPILG